MCAEQQLESWRRHRLDRYPLEPDGWPGGVGAGLQLLESSLDSVLVVQGQSDSVDVALVYDIGRDELEHSRQAKLACALPRLGGRRCESSRGHRDAPDSDELFRLDLAQRPAPLGTGAAD